ncbi:MAG TPA: YdeI/OmpD-associated family protein [Chitinophagaceae bacterium]|nr:YdeI/OmpD-associated family protein [Chitinophagaceae bacterium]
MPSTLAQKLKIKEGNTLLTFNPPKDFKSKLGDLPGGVKISASSKNPDQLHWFVKDKSQMEKELPGIMKMVKGEVICWIYYPKGTSKIQTDLTRDKGWDSLLAHKELQWISLISFDETWSTFAFRLKTEADKKKEANVKPREIWNYVDPVKKTVKIPDDLEKSLKKSKKANELFQALSFTNKKEYVEWIVTAKREETRNERVNGSIERLEKGWKNPRNM